MNLQGAEVVYFLHLLSFWHSVYFLHRLSKCDQVSQKKLVSK